MEFAYLGEDAIQGTGSPLQMMQLAAQNALAAQNTMLQNPAQYSQYMTPQYAAFLKSQQGGIGGKIQDFIEQNKQLLVYAGIGLGGMVLISSLTRGGSGGRRSSGGRRKRKSSRRRRASGKFA